MGRSNDFIHAFASLAQTVLQMGGFYHSVLTAHQLLKGIQSNIQKNGEGRALKGSNVCCTMYIFLQKLHNNCSKMLRKCKPETPIVAATSRKLCEVGHFLVKAWVALMI